MAILNAPMSKLGVRNIMREAAIQPIERFSAALVGDGVTDDSVAFKAAHDAAYAAGVRQLYCSKQYNIPTAFEIGDVLFFGPGRLIGHNHKFIAPLGARSAYDAKVAFISPPVHLTKLAAASSPIVVLVGDSRSTTAANFASPLVSMWGIMRREFMRKNPGKTFTFYNRAISGQTWAVFNSTSTTDPNPSGKGWTWESGKAWRQQVRELQADVVVFAFGMNGASQPTDVIGSLSYICGGAKVPDIIFVTSPSPTLLAGTAATQDDRLKNAGLMRSIATTRANVADATIPPIGLIDAGRLATRASRGFDPADHVLERTLTNVTGITSFPYSMGRVKDFELKVTFPGQAAAATSPAFTVRLDGSQAFSQVNIDNGNGGAGRVRALLLNGGSTQTSGSWILPTSGDWTYQISLRESQLRVAVDSAGAVIDNLFTRWDAAFDMQINSTLAGANMTIDYLNIGKPVVCSPVFTDAEMWGVTGNPLGGNGFNHEAPFGISVLEAAWAQADLTAA